MKEFRTQTFGSLNDASYWLESTLWEMELQGETYIKGEIVLINDRWRASAITEPEQLELHLGDA